MKRFGGFAWGSLVGAWLLSGCAEQVVGNLDNDDNTTPTTYDWLTLTTAIGPGGDCLHGGTRFDAGFDNGDGEGTADDGVLQEDEIDETHFVCDTFPLVQVKHISLGDEDCPTGGETIETGLDNGDGEGIAGDGILHPDEIDNIEIICNADVDDIFTSPEDPTPGPYAIDVAGGGPLVQAVLREAEAVFSVPKSTRPRAMRRFSCVAKVRWMPPLPCQRPVPI